MRYTADNGSTYRDANEERKHNHLKSGALHVPNELLDRADGHALAFNHAAVLGCTGMT